LKRGQVCRVFLGPSSRRSGEVSPFQGLTTPLTEQVIGFTASGPRERFGSDTSQPHFDGYVGFDVQGSSGGNGANTQGGLSLSVTTKWPLDQPRPASAAALDSLGLFPHVAILRWPADAVLIAYSRAEGRSCLLLVEADGDLPVLAGWSDDWIRLPARDSDIQARAAMLEARIARPDPLPEVDLDGHLLFDSRGVFLSPSEEALMRLLCQRFGQVVDVESLAGAVGEGGMSANAVRVQLTRLRKRIGTVGLVVRAIHGRGYVLEQATGQQRYVVAPPG
jgi:hypothetical protein